ncbi:MAG: c-type cytochrome biogenesis protein CcsB [Nitriliruptorales bacterium]
MTETALAELSRTLFFPVTFLLYLAAMFAYFFRMAFTRLDRVEGRRPRVGEAVGVLGVVVAVSGLATHLAAIVTRSMASGGRVPWGNMYEYSSAMAFGTVLVAVLFVHARLKRPELVGFIVFGALVIMTSALFLYTPAGPLMPALQTHWLKIHTFAAMAASSVFTVAFVFTGLYLIRDLAERRVAERQAAAQRGSTVGAAYLRPRPALDEAARPAHEGEKPDTTGRIQAGESDGRPVGYVDDGALEDPEIYGQALREVLNPVPMAVSAAAITLAYSLLFRNTVASVIAPLIVGLGVLAAWWFLPALPSAATLDSLAYRTTAFAFPIWTFAVLAGAVWAEQSWGRYWGWDPKETGAFLTWVAYAGYLHSRATRGLRGRGAAGIGIIAFLLLMFTYYAVNLWITGLHSYAGSGAAKSNPPYAAIAGALALWAVVRFLTSSRRATDRRSVSESHLSVRS